MSDYEDKRRQRMCGCMPGHPCAMHNGHSAQPTQKQVAVAHAAGQVAGALANLSAVVAATEPQKGTTVQPNYKKQKQQCKLCACEGYPLRFANGTQIASTLCKEHLEGYRYACSFLPDETVRELVRLISVQETTKEADDNGKSK